MKHMSSLGWAIAVMLAMFLAMSLGHITDSLAGFLTESLVDPEVT